VRRRLRELAAHGEIKGDTSARWTSLTEVRLKDKHVKSAGNIDLVLVSYDGYGKVTDFGALEVQAVYISGNVRNPFEYYMSDPAGRANMNWRGNGKRAGTRLYTHNDLDHEELFIQAKNIKGELLMTYDNAEEVIQMAIRHGFMQKAISMMNTHHATMQELIIGHDLTWIPS
jgi:hypothetical protein